MNHLEQIKRQFDSLGAYSEAVSGHSQRITLTGAYRVTPEPKSPRELFEGSESFRWEPDKAVRTALVFGANGRFLSQHSRFNAPRKG